MKERMRPSSQGEEQRWPQKKQHQQAEALGPMIFFMSNPQSLRSFRPEHVEWSGEARSDI